MSQSSSIECSPLAWELAQNARLDLGKAFRATVYVRGWDGGRASGRSGKPITGHGATSTEAMRSLAHQLDCWQAAVLLSPDSRSEQP